MIQSFPSVASPDAEVLILGSMPGERSLQEQQYYAHPYNAFWDIMGALFRASRHLEYEERLRILKENRVALWDVAFQCRRDGSLDSDIRSVTPNDFQTFFASHPQIHSIFFNGHKAEDLFTKLVLKNLGDFSQKLKLVRLPSTSPAHASLTRDQKKRRWQRELKVALTFSLYSGTQS
ncbi:MAG: DNA-deoxyinosine glycosylase [Deltaproteobacteria bacterium]|nr:DNA-deoxyinosine glycosylase [Deltaproteobacteria bacterium]